MEHNEANLAELAGANTPADRGLSGLGLLMQLSGSMFIAFGAYITFLPLIEGSHGGPIMGTFFVGVCSVVRSVFHRSAGMAILYGTAKGFRHSIQMYCGAALAQSVAVVLFMANNDAPGKMTILAFALLMIWPAILFFAMSRPRFKTLEKELPRAEDLGFEAAAVMMTILGLAGCLLSGLVLITAVRFSEYFLHQVPGLLWTGVAAMLFVRSALHLKAGWQGTSGVHAERASSSASTYFNFGVISSIIAGAVLLMQIVMSSSTLHFVDLIGTALFTYLLFVWPTALRNFFTDRNFSLLLDEQTVTRRAPDTGLTALGWALLATGAVDLTMTLGSAILFPGETNGSMLMLTFFGGGGGGLHSIWWSIGVAGLQTYAGIELVRMSPNYRIVTSIYGGVATMIACYLWWPLLEGFQGMISMDPLMSSPLLLLSTTGPIALSLTLGLVSVFLVNRNNDPDARARIRE